LGDLVKELQADSLRAFIDEILSRPKDTDEIHSRPADTSAYDMLACLAYAGYFDTVLTTNWDFLLETALARVFSPREYRVFVRGELHDEAIAEALGRWSPVRLNVVKLHGDTFFAPILSSAKLMNFELPLQERLAAMISERGIVVVGYALKEPFFWRIAKKPDPAYYVDPGQPDRRKLKMLGVAENGHVSGEDGKFHNFVQGLCYKLLGEQYRKSWEPSQTNGQLRRSAPILVTEEKEVEAKVDGIKKRISCGTLNEDRVLGLVRDMLQQIQTQFGQHLEDRGKGLCLVFIKDPSAPGGSEILQLVKSRKELQDLTRGMQLESVEITSRLEQRGSRKVARWQRESSRSLKNYGAVVLVDSVTFTGNTLEVVRRTLVKREERRADRFIAAVLLLPVHVKQQLEKQGFTVISSSQCMGYEVTFPWGHTRATRPVFPESANRRDEFIPAERFGFTPKPWGDQVTFCSNEQASVHLLRFDPGQRTSFHYHLLRAETFVVLDNHVRVVLWNRYIELRQHESIRVPAGVPHSIIALDQPCRVLEIAEGYYDQRRDIVRVEDIYEYAREPAKDGTDDGFR
jgi:mannose-6-phosphate isomerase-like protein (cupin superfamily)